MLIVLKDELCCISQVALFASLSTCLLGSYLSQGSSMPSLMPTIEERVPSRPKEGQNGVLFYRIKLKTLSSAALEFGITKID